MGARFNLHQDREGWLYLTVVLDLADRKVVGKALSETLEAEATSVAAWQMAVRNRPLFHSLLFHSDRGVQYACSAFREQLEGMPVQQSMSRKEKCWDNAVAESFFKTMKTEMAYHHKFATRKVARLAVFEYIESFYNRKRRHSALSYRTPCQYENLLYRNATYGCLKKVSSRTLQFQYIEAKAY
ncbi:IS3 family transposase [Pontibacter toksunensis]|uniref:IS3 family transposase n=1 Tax=Pontibacter toksunensis TaxID=1332631 RepID=A0ABW6C2W2_9BACT